MARILVAFVRGVEMDGTFATVSGDKVNLTGDVKDFCRALKDWSPGLAGVELRQITVFGPWVAAPPKLAIWTAKLADADAALAANVVLSTLIGATGDYFFIARITAPIPAAAAGASTIVTVGPPQWPC